jgi:hypothetical protein
MDGMLFGKNDEKKEKLIKTLFKRVREKKIDKLQTNFTRIRLHLKHFRKYSKFKNTFQTECVIDDKKEKAFVFFKDRVLYLFKESRYYYKDEQNFSKLIFLIRFDEFRCWPINQTPNSWKVELKNIRDKRGFEFDIQQSDLVMFLFNLCAQTCLAHSPYLMETHLPDPFHICGSFFLKFRFTSKQCNKIKMNLATD